MSNNRAKYLFKNTAIFTIGSFATKIVNFILIPLYSFVLSAEEYGTIDLVATVCFIAVPIITLNITESVMRFNLDPGVNRDQITKVGLYILAFSALIGLCIIPICSMFDQISDLKYLIYFYVITNASNQVLLSNLRGREQLISYSVCSVLNTFLIALFNIIFLVFLKLQLPGFLLAYILSNTVVSICAFILGKSYRAILARFEYDKFITMIKYSVVLIPNSFMWWIMNSSDHLMVTSMVGVAANGIYAMSYKIPNLISTFTGIFNQAWQYSAIKENGSNDEAAYNNKVFKVMISIVMLIGISIMTIVKPFFRFYLSKEYFSAWKYTPFLIIGSVFMTLGTFMSTSYNVHKDNKGFLFSGMIGAFLNLVLNFILIPTIGVYGAAMATCLSYISVFVYRYFDTKKYIKYNIIIKEFYIGVILLILSAVLVYFESILSTIFQVLIFLISMCLFKDAWAPILFKVIRKVKDNDYSM